MMGTQNNALWAFLWVAQKSGDFHLYGLWVTEWDTLEG